MRCFFAVQFIVAATMQLAAFAGLTKPLPKSISEVQWIYAPPADNPPTNACLRLAFDVKKPVRRAYFYTFLEKCKGKWLDGKPVRLPYWKPFANYRGHVKANGMDMTSQMTVGRHVLAFRLDYWPQKCCGMILRGEIEYKDGERQTLLSTADQFKASGKEEPGWKEPGFDDSKWSPAWEQGDARLPPWGRFGETMRIYASPQEYAFYTNYLATGGGAQYDVKRLLAEPDTPNARVVYSGGTPGIETNGKVLPPYVPTELPLEANEASERYLTHLREAGISIVGIVRFRRSKYAIEGGRYDFTEFGGGVRRMLALHPEARFFLYYRNGGGLPAGWADAHPDELVGYAVKNKNMKESAYTGNARVPSFASKLYRDEERAFWREFGDYVRSQPWGRRILGVHCGYGGSGDGMPCGANCMPDTGKRMTEAFRKYLAEKYGSDEALRKAWGDGAVTIAEASVPDRTLRCGSGMYLRDISDPRDRRVADYYDCYHKVFAEFMIDFGDAVKSALPGRLVGAYFGYYILGYSPEGNTARIGELLRSDRIDYFYATTRGYCLTDCLHRNIASLCRQYGKFTSIEGDVRPHNSLLFAPEKWRCKSPEESRSTFSKVVATALVRGTGWQMVDFGINNTKAEPWFDTQEALEPMSVAVREWNARWRNPVSTPNEVAVVFDLDQVWKQGHAKRHLTEVLANNLATYPMQSLNFSGIPYDLMVPEGYLASKNRYRAVVFLNLFEADGKLRRSIRDRLAADKTTAIWCYAPGLIDSGKGFSEVAMKDLTGIKLGIKREQCAFVMQDASGAETTLFGAKREWKDAPRAFVQDRSAAALAKWKDDGTVSIARKRLSDGTTSIFFGMAPHEPATWAKLLADAGCHAFTPHGFMVRRGNGILEVFSGKGATIPPESKLHEKQLSQSGRVELSLPKGMTIGRDLFTGERPVRSGGRLLLKSDRPRTWMFKID